MEPLGIITEIDKVKMVSSINPTDRKAVKKPMKMPLCIGKFEFLSIDFFQNLISKEIACSKKYEFLIDGLRINNSIEVSSMKISKSQNLIFNLCQIIKKTT